MLFAFIFFWGKEICIWMKTALCEKKKPVDDENNKNKAREGEDSENDDAEFGGQGINDSDAQPILGNEEVGFDRPAKRIHN